MLERMKAILIDDPSETLYDNEISDLIAAAQAELKDHGVTDYSNTSNPRIWRYLVLYCRTYFRTPPDYDKLLKATEGLLQSLAQTTGHTDFSGGGCE